MRLRPMRGFDRARHLPGWGVACTRRFAGAAAAALGIGCSAEPGMARSLGVDLGTFGVAAAADENECGPGALGSTARFDFEVDLARADTELFWDGNIGGRLGPGLEFEFAASVVVELRPVRFEDAGCAILREDLISGRLEPDTSGVVTAFSGAMRFDFAERAGSMCTAAEQDEAQLPHLPCRMSYDLSGRRTRAPEPRGTP